MKMNSLQLKQLIREALTEVKKAKDAKKSKHEKGETKAQEKKEHTSGKEKTEKSEKPTAKKTAPKTTAKPKSTGKLVDLKKEKDALKSMQEALGKYMVNEGESEAQLEAAFSHQESYINEMAKIKEMTANLAEKMNSDLTLVEEKIKAETAKIKDMMGVGGIDEKKKPAMGMAKSEKPAIAKKAPMKDMSKPSKGFEKVAKK
jgi:hypothetical protein